MTSHANSGVDGKPVKYSNEFKLAAVERVKEVGYAQTADEMKLNASTLKGWAKLRLNPHTCTICEKAFPYKAAMKKHMLVHPEYRETTGIAAPPPAEKNTSTRYDAAFKQEVTQFALINSIQAATAKFNLSHSTVNYWVKFNLEPKSCTLCGKDFANVSTLRRHLEQVHKFTTEGMIDQAKEITQDSLKQGFAQFLAGRDLLPSEEIVRAREEEKEKREREKQEFAETAREIFEQEKERWLQVQMNKGDEKVKVKQEQDNSKEDPELKTAIKLSLNLTKLEQRDAKLNRTDSADNNGNDEGGLDHNEKDDVEMEMDNNDGYSDNEFSEVKEEPNDLDETPQSDEDLDSSMYEPSTSLEYDNSLGNQEDQDANCVKGFKFEWENDDGKLNDTIKEEPAESNEDDVKVPKNKIRKKRKKNDETERIANDEGYYSCKICAKLFPTKQRVALHEKIVHLGEFVTNCEFCGTTFKEDVKLQEHQLRKHPEEYSKKIGEPILRFDCDLCERKFNVKRDYKRHMKMSHGPKVKAEYKFTCDDCGKSFTRKTYLRTHQRKFHNMGEPSKTEGMKFPCPHCDQIYNKKDSLNRHIRVIHDENRVQCEICSKLFCDQSGLNRHMLYHGEEQFECNLCKRKFRENRQLAAHLKLHESGVEDFPDGNECPVCHKTMASASSLRNHIATFHENDSGEIHVCNVCGKEHKTARHLKNHMKIHTEKYINKKWTCETCGAEYKSTVSLKNHISTIHLGERNFACHICGKNFTRAGVLRAHMKVHEGSKPFHCIYCNSSYGEKRNLMTHLSRNHPGFAPRYRRDTQEGSSILEISQPGMPALDSLPHINHGLQNPQSQEHLRASGQTVI